LSNINNIGGTKPKIVTNSYKPMKYEWMVIGIPSQLVNYLKEKKNRLSKYKINQSSLQGSALISKTDFLEFPWRPLKFQNQTAK